MAVDVNLYLVRPGSQSFGSTCVGHLNTRNVLSSGQTNDGQKCLDIEVAALPPQQPLVQKQGNREVPLHMTWLQLNVDLYTNQIPHRRVGHVIVGEAGTLPVTESRSGPARWLWEILAEDAEQVERVRAPSPTTPIYLTVNMSGLVKFVDPASGTDVGIAAVRSDSPQLEFEQSQWDRLMQQLGYDVPPSQGELAGVAVLDHPSWKDASERLKSARAQHRSGDDYDALRGCLNALEAIVLAPYNKTSWTSRLTTLPTQKAEGLSEMFSRVATFCNRIGHHRERNHRDPAGDLPVMPLNHWEAELALGLTQFALAYVLRLRASGLLIEPPPPPAPPPAASTPATDEPAINTTS